MPGLTLAEARTVIQGHLDDDGTRWTASTGGEIDTALRYAISESMEEYAAKGGDRFKELVSSTTTSSGTLDLSSYSPMSIHEVAVISGARRYPVSGVHKSQIDTPDDTARSIEVWITRTPTLPTTTSHPVIGNGATAIGSWDAFDFLVCSRAARFLLAKDGEVHGALRDLEDRLRQSVMSAPRIPRSFAPDRNNNWFSQFLRWSWNPRSKALALSKVLCR